MRVILLDKIKNLGNIGEEVNVKAGYARNFLIPTTKAVLATDENISSFKTHTVSLEQDLIRIQSEKAQHIIAKIKKIKYVTIQSKSSISGKLFGSIGIREISDAVFSKTGVKLSKYNIILPDKKKIRALGEYNIVIKFYRRISTVLNVRVVGVS